MGVLSIGDYTYGHDNIKRQGDMNNVTIGKYCSIADNVIIDSGFQHRADFVSTFPFKNRFGIGEQNAYCKGDVQIGNDVWIGRDVIIMGDVKIGDGAIIGAGSIVTADVKPYSIVAGNPARFIRLRFTEFQIHALLVIKWWNWNNEKVIHELPSATDVVTFIKKHYPI